jgi:hypothetical protein
VILSTITPRSTANMLDAGAVHSMNSSGSLEGGWRSATSGRWLRRVREERRVGLQYLDAVTTLLQRVRGTHPTHGLYPAAELQWWWDVLRSTDHFEQVFWFDDLSRREPPSSSPISATHGDHRGLARHILTTGADLLAEAGGQRISIGFEPDNPASGGLYRSVGFDPHLRTDVFSCDRPL